MSKIDSRIQWLVRTQSGKQIGPYGTDAILKMISEGAFAGLEQIKRYPDGRWKSISKHPDFYDQLLESLEEMAKKPVSGEPSKNFDQNKKIDQYEQETVIVPPPVKLSETPVQNEVRKIVIKNNEVSSEQSKPQLNRGPVIDLKQYAELPKKKSVQLPFLLAMAAIASLLVFIFWTEPLPENQDQKPNLLFPKKAAQATLSAEEIKTGIQRAILSYTQDTYENYADAQNKLVLVIEGAPQNISARGSLCLVYKELWPYVKQDAQDLNSVVMMARATRNIDPTGIDGVYCEVTKLMIQGKYNEARGVIDYALNQPALSTAPVLYAIKAELLFEDRDNSSAILYMEKASQLWPDWVKPFFELGKYRASANQYSPAMRDLQQVMKMNPKHKLSQIESGILMYKGFRQLDSAASSLSSALATTGRISRIEQARAHFYLALIYQDKSDKKAALQNATKAFQLNPADALIKELLVKLGGSTKLGAMAAENNELVYLGDQHFRTGNCLAAQAEYKAAYELNPKNAVAAMKAAKCMWILSQSDEAISWLEKAIKSDPKLTTAYFLKADYHSQRYNFVQATQVLNKASRLFNNNYEILRGYGLIEYRRNNIKDATAYLLRANKVYENDIDTLILLAKSFSASGDFESARKYAVRAIEIDATNNEAQIVYSQVLTKFQGVDMGSEYLRDLISKFSYSIELRYALAELYRDQERAIQAQRIYEQIIDADPKNKKARLGLGKSLQQQGQTAAALKQFLEAAILDPSDAEGLFFAGILYYETGKNNDAITQLKRAQGVNPLYPRINYFIGRAYFQMGDMQQALSSAMAERKINPNLSDSYILAAEVYAAQKEFNRCASEYQQALKIRPLGADLYVRIARCYRQAGSVDIAESMLNIAATQESGLAEIYREQGAIYEVKGDIRAAVQAFNKYLALSPNALDRREIEGKILSLSDRK